MVASPRFGHRRTMQDAPSHADDVRPLTVAGLQRLLNSIAVGDQLTVSLAEIRRLFGTDDAGAGRLAHFARGHGCSLAPSPTQVIFNKTTLP